MQPKSLILLLLALALLSTSVASDIFWKEPSVDQLLFEDGSKLLGIGAWAAFHIESGMVLLGHHLLSRRGT